MQGVTCQAERFWTQTALILTTRSTGVENLSDVTVSRFGIELALIVSVRPVTW